MLNLVYKKLAVILTDRENWRTDLEYQTELVFKMFVYQFLNSFTALYYTAFLQACSPSISNSTP